MIKVKFIDRLPVMFKTDRVTQKELEALLKSNEKWIYKGGDFFVIPVKVKKIN